ncbi:MAG: ABC transporter permease, partial [Candidatus Thorarchaeota archaeon]
MSVESQTLQPGIETAERKSKSKTFARVARYTAAKLVMLVITVAIGVYLTILIANMGGYVDSIMRGQIRESIGLRMASDPAFRGLTAEQRKTLTENEIAREEKRLGLNQPFVIRSFRFLSNAMVLELGRAQLMSSDEGSKQVRLIILERLPPTLLLFGTSNLLLFFGSIFFALALSRKYGTFWDKVVIGLSPTSSAPPWFY